MPVPILIVEPVQNTGDPVRFDFLFCSILRDCLAGVSIEGSKDPPVRFGIVRIHPDPRICTLFHILIAVAADLLPGAVPVNDHMRVVHGPFFIPFSNIKASGKRHPSQGIKDCVKGTSICCNRINLPFAERALIGHRGVLF